MHAYVNLVQLFLNYRKKTNHNSDESAINLYENLSYTKIKLKYNYQISQGRKEMFYLTTHSTHFIYGYMASDIW